MLDRDEMRHHPHRILVVEDELALREILRDALSDEGHRVELAADGQEGLEKLQARPRPCVVLVDLLMPRLNGWQMTSRMRADAALARIPVVIISANPQYAPDAIAMDARWLTKPVDLDELSAMVNELCAGPPGAGSQMEDPAAFG